MLEFIKNRKTIRKYRKRMVSLKVQSSVLEAGVWASSVHGFQPWRFVATTNRRTIKTVSNILKKKADTIGKGINTLLRLTATTIEGSPFIVFVYNTGTFTNIAYRFFKIDKKYAAVAKLTETQAVAGAIQNMLLEAESLGLGSCWTATPIFSQKEINALLDEEGELLGILTFGYPAEEGKRSPRISPARSIRHIA